MVTLNEDELRSIICITGGTNFDTKKEKKYWDLLTKDLLIKQPELNSIYNNFIEFHLKDKMPILGFLNLFENKIFIESFIEKSFYKHYSYNGDNRNSFFKSISNKFPNFIVKLHYYINENKQHLADFDIYDTYFQLLKSKKIDSSILNNNEVLENINSFFVDRDANSFKKKINAYLNYFPRDENLYNKIMDNNEIYINQSATLKNIWEEKIQLFPPEVILKHQKNKIKFIPSQHSEGFYYSFSLNEEYIVEFAKVKLDTAVNFRNKFLENLGEFIVKNIPDSKIINTGKRNSMQLILSDFESKEKTKNFCKIIEEDFASLLQPKFLNLSVNELLNFELNSYLTRLFFVIKLDESLSTKEDNFKPKNKI